MTSFIVDLETISDQLRERKGNTVQYLIRHFQKDVDFEESKTAGARGRPKIKFMLTDICAKTLVVSRISRFRHETEDAVAGIQIMRYQPPNELKTINFIQECLIDFNPVLQYAVLTYRIDLYFPDYGIAVECDEFLSHLGCATTDDKRQHAIEHELKCVFIRFNPDWKKFKIQSIIAQIFKLISKQVCLRCKNKENP